jgi:hypothetical protein
VKKSGLAGELVEKQGIDGDVEAPLDMVERVSVNGRH